jgi:glycosyltransferase involved in cell wall biosynthesis
MIRLSCSVKLYAFNLAEQLDKKHLLGKFYTIYHSLKDPVTAVFNQRKDQEQIDLKRIKTFSYLAPVIKLRNNHFANNALFDALVAQRLRKDNNYEVFIGWSGMSLKSIRQAKNDGKKVLLERASSHIRFQFDLLQEEYARWGYEFKGDERVAAQEEMEYNLADYVVIPSDFVRKTFHDRGYRPLKLFRNNFGSNSLFKPSRPKRNKFTIVYAGSLSLRKGLPYLFEALSMLKLDPRLFEVWFIGSITDEIRAMIPRHQKDNWKFFGHVNQGELSHLISQCSVAVQPSLEEGLSMVIPQFIACGTPVIATTNTGAGDIIQNGINGFMIPIRSPEAIVEKIMTLFNDPDLVFTMGKEATAVAETFGGWDQYGDRYADFLGKIIA